MMTCHDVSTLVSTGALAAAPFRRRVGVWLHLTMCRHCRAFKRQIDTIARAARAAAEAFDGELSEDFESRIVRSLRPHGDGG